MTTRNRFRPTPARLAFAGVGLLIAAGVDALRSQPLPKAGSPLQVANDLDGVIQPRFLQNAGMFGLTRVIPVVNGHTVGYMGSLGVETPDEKKALARADSARRDYTVAFLHCAHVPGQFVRPGVFKPVSQHGGKVVAVKPWLSTLIVTRDPSPAAQKASAPLTGDDGVQRQWQEAALGALPRLQQGHDAQAKVADWTLVMRPVRASADSCVSCHVGSKKGETLGVMVYAVRNKVNPIPVSFTSAVGKSNTP